MLTYESLVLEQRCVFREKGEPLLVTVSIAVLSDGRGIKCIQCDSQAQTRVSEHGGESHITVKCDSYCFLIITTQAWQPLSPCFRVSQAEAEYRLHGDMFCT